MKSFLSQNSIEFRSSQCVSHSEAKYKSFKLSVGLSQMRVLLDELVWPDGVRVRKYYPAQEDGLTQW